MKIIIVLFCLISLDASSQKDTCYSVETDFYSGTSTYCGSFDRKGLWHGTYSETHGTGLSDRSYTLREFRMKHGKQYGKARFSRKAAHTYEFVLIEKSRSRNGKDVGKYRFWDMEGRLIREGRYRNDYHVGVWTTCDTNGVILHWKKHLNKRAYREKQFQEGKLQVSRYVDTKKKIRAEHYYNREGIEVDIEVYRKAWN
jgi:antitoxin component YwqK of YwqJK toxin-antitoxin module